MISKIKLLLIALTLSVSANAQEKTELDVFKHTAIDTTQLIVSYDLTVNMTYQDRIILILKRYILTSDVRFARVLWRVNIMPT